jgi:hypothetical protein
MSSNACFITIIISYLATAAAAVAGAFTVAMEGMKNMEDWAFYSVERTKMKQLLPTLVLFIGPNVSTV